MGTITATGLGKAYKQYSSPWSRLAEWLLPVRGTPHHRLHWILQGIDLAIAPGETVGLIGSTGRSTGPHLHLSLVVLGESVDPATVVDI